MVELVDTRDLKSLGRKAVPVRFRLRAPVNSPTKTGQVLKPLKFRGFFCCLLSFIVHYGKAESKGYDGISDGICQYRQDGYRQKGENAMPKRITPLSDIQVRAAKPKESDYKLTDGGGLYLAVTTTGGKLWRMDYRFGDKRKTASFGAYPTITLAEARQRRDDAKKLLANGVDPGEIKKAQKAAQGEQDANTFEVIAREWHSKFAHTWVLKDRPHPVSANYFSRK